MLVIEVKNDPAAKHRVLHRIFSQNSRYEVINIIAESSNQERLRIVVGIHWLRCMTMPLSTPQKWYSAIY
jgi:hypothetical protein